MSWSLGTFGLRELPPKSNVKSAFLTKQKLTAIHEIHIEKGSKSLNKYKIVISGLKPTIEVVATDKRHVKLMHKFLIGVKLFA